MERVLGLWVKRSESESSDTVSSGGAAGKSFVLLESPLQCGKLEKQELTMRVGISLRTDMAKCREKCF